MRALLPLCLLLACAEPSPPQLSVPRPPTVRVHLRSLGKWQSVRISSKGGGETVLRRDSPSQRLSAPGGVLTIDGHAYSGELHWRGGKLINHVSMENYVLGVLRGEIPLKDVPVAAAAAQAIAVRSYTMHYLAQKRSELDLDDTTLYQRYVGMQYAPQDNHLREGVLKTRGLYLEYAGAPLKCYYHSTCGGHTTDVSTGLSRPAVAPMNGVKCDHCRASKYYRWTARLPETTILEAAEVEGPLRLLEVSTRDAGGRAKQLNINGQRVRANEFRLRAGPSLLRSTNILALRRERGTVVVEGAGWGHGVGMCQMGAIGLGGKGLSGEQIAAYYYPGAKLSRAY